MEHFVTDHRHRTIYITDERWEHTTEEHPEMIGYFEHLLKTLKTGRRKQDFYNPQIYRYYRQFSDLPNGNRLVVVVVKFGIKQPDETPNNFVLTAYQV